MKKWILIFVLALASCRNLASGGTIKDMDKKIKEKDSESSYVKPTAQPIVQPTSHPSDPPISGTMKKKAVEVTFQRDTSNGQEYAIYTGMDENGKTLWTYQTDAYYIGQLNSTFDIGLQDDGYYLSEDGKIIKLSLYDGSVIWVNSDFGGSVGGSDFDNEGTLYVCGYFGPDLFVVNKDGETLSRVEHYDANLFWASDIQWLGDRIAITYDGAGAEPVTVYYPLDAEWMQIAQVSATSFLSEPQYNIYHIPENICDNDLSTAWVEGVDGQGYGETLTIYMATPATVSGVTIVNGYQASEHVYYVNSRPRQLDVTINGQFSFAIDLEDIMGEQSFSFDKPVEAQDISFTIKDVYPGSKYEDTCISEISLF